MKIALKNFNLDLIAIPNALKETKHKKTAGSIPAENVPDGSIMLRYSSFIVTA